MTIVTVILATVPFISGLLAWVLLGEKMDLYSIITMFICFGAIVLLAIAKSDSSNISGTENNYSDYNAQKYNHFSYVAGIFFTIGGAVGISTGLLTNRKMQNVHRTVIQLNSNFTASIVYLVWVIWRFFKAGEIPFTH